MNNSYVVCSLIVKKAGQIDVVLKFEDSPDIRLIDRLYEGEIRSARKWGKISGFKYWKQFQGTWSIYTHVSSFILFLWSFRLNLFWNYSLCELGAGVMVKTTWV